MPVYAERKERGVREGEEEGKEVKKSRGEEVNEIQRAVTFEFLDLYMKSKAPVAQLKIEVKNDVLHLKL